jgi:hypothetical protein
MSDFAVNLPPDFSSYVPAGLREALESVDLRAAVDAATAPYKDNDYFRADAAAQEAQRAYEARQAAYKAANPDASLFATQWNSMTPEMQAQTRASYGTANRGLDDSLRYTGVAPTEGQDLVDYMLANNGAMPTVGPKPFDTKAALLKVALLAGGFAAMPALAGFLGAGAAGAGAGAAGATAAGSIIPSTVAGLVPTSTALGAGSAAGALGATLGTAGTAAAGTALAGALPGTVSELVITGFRAGMTIPQVAAVTGLSTAAVNSVLQGSSGSDVAQGDSGIDRVEPSQTDPTTVDELVVTAATPTPAPTLVPPVINPFQPNLTSTPNPTLDPVDPDLGTEVSELVVTAATPPPAPTLVPPIIAPGPLTPTPNPTLDPVAPDEPAVVDNPTLVPPIVDPGPLTPPPNPKLDDDPGLGLDPKLIKTLITLLGGGGGAAAGGKKGPSTLPPGVMDAGQPGSTSSIFRSTLPPPSGPFANMSARNVSMTPEEWKTYGQRGQVAFLSSTPQRPSGIDNSVQAPPMPGPSANPEDFARGGFAVRGPGTGRSDDIPARLSDGEYVIDAETVSLLGDGSTKSGASKLDQFRVNIRKHKGRKLAKGAFSVDAKKPEAYLRGGQAR